MSTPADITKVTLTTKHGDTLSVLEFLDQGRDGIVFKARMSDRPGTLVAVKFYAPLGPGSLYPNPSKFAAFAEDLEYRCDNELKRLRELSHPNLQKYISGGIFEYDKSYFATFKSSAAIGSRIPFLVTELVEGSRLDKAIESGAATFQDVVGWLGDIVSALHYLHENKVLHFDIGTHNILIAREAKKPVLIDFGLSKNFAVEAAGLTRLFFDGNAIPEKVRQALQSLGGEHDHWDKATVFPLLFPFVDLYHFGLLIEKLLSRDRFTDSLDAYRFQLLTMIAAELRRWDVVEERKSLRSMMRGSITSTNDLKRQVHKLRLGSDYYQYALIERERQISRTIVRHRGSVDIRNSVAPLLSHPGLRRLHNLLQLSLLHYVYPSATQSRFDHILSALGRTQEVWRALSKDAAFVLHMDVEDIDRLEVAALVHDLNHFPFLHYFQEAGVPGVGKAEILRAFLDIEGEMPAPGTTLRQLLSQRSISEDYVRGLLSSDEVSTGNAADEIIKSVINSGVDVDKLAYLPDDAAFTGVPFGKAVDIQGLLDGVSVARCATAAGSMWHIVFAHDALPAVESVCSARFWNFQRVYWHHTNRAMAAMIIWTIQRISETGRLDMKDYLERTRNVGESGALEYLSGLYSETHDGRPAPIHHLSTNRDVLFRRVFELPLAGYDDVLLGLKKGDRASLNRREATERVIGVVKSFLESRGSDISIADADVLLDVPLRDLDLGGGIYIRTPDGAITNGTSASKRLEQLKVSLQELSRVVRVFVSPRVRDAVGAAVWDRHTKDFGEDIVKAIVGKRFVSEVG